MALKNGPVKHTILSIINSETTVSSGYLIKISSIGMLGFGERGYFIVTGLIGMLPNIGQLLIFLGLESKYI